jgi:hypothetical protein
MQHADSANVEGADAIPPSPVPGSSTSRQQFPDEAAPSDFDRLKDILFGDERGTLDGLDARVAALDRNQRELSARLPAAIERAQEGTGAARMATALAKPVTQALGAAVQENRQLIVDVLFPIIGPAIRKAIAEALRNLVADVNGAIESSLTPRGIRWRIEAWRRGVPYAEVVLKHTLNYGIDHVFLIERESGLVLDRESAPHLPDLDADAIAGMLTAMGEFVRDSVDRDGAGTLDSARVGEHLLWIVHGPRANLACFIHGVPPPRLHALLEQRLEAIHSQLGENVSAGNGDDAWRRSLRPDELMREVLATGRPPTKSRSRGPLLVVLLAVIALLALGVVRHQRESARWENLRARLSTHAGFVLTGIDNTGSALTVHGLIDPDADPVEPSLADAGFAAAQATFDTVGYLSTDDAIIARRARRLLVAPPSVTIAANGGVLVVGGHAAATWVDAAHERAAWIPGVREVKFEATRESDAVALARSALDALAQTISQRRIVFVRDDEPAPEAAAVLEEIIGDALRAQALATTAGAGIEWIATGTNDDPGSDTINARVRALRARWLADALAARGVERVRTAADDDALALEERQRGAFLRPIMTEPPR